MLQKQYYSAYVNTLIYIAVSYKQTFRVIGAVLALLNKARAGRGLYPELADDIDSIVKSALRIYMQAHLQRLAQKTWLFLNLSSSICKQAPARYCSCTSQIQSCRGGLCHSVGCCVIRSRLGVFVCNSFRLLRHLADQHQAFWGECCGVMLYQACIYLLYKYKQAWQVYTFCLDYRHGSLDRQCSGHLAVLPATRPEVLRTVWCCHIFFVIASLRQKLVDTIMDLSSWIHKSLCS